MKSSQQAEIKTVPHKASKKLVPPIALAKTVAMRNNEPPPIELK